MKIPKVNIYTGQKKIEKNLPVVVQSWIDTSIEGNGFFYAVKKFSNGHIQKDRIDIRFPR